MKWLCLFHPDFWRAFWRTARAATATSMAARRQGHSPEEARTLGRIAADLEREAMDREDALR